MDLIIDGEPIEFSKAAKSHLDGNECLYVGQAADGQVKIIESDDPSQVITTSAAKLQTFADAVSNGEFTLS